MAQRMSLLVNDLWPAKWGDIRESIDATDESMVIAEFAKQIPNTCKTTEMTHTSLFFVVRKQLLAPARGARKCVSAVFSVCTNRFILNTQCMHKEVCCLR